MDKRVAIVAGDEVLDVVVTPGATVHDVLRQAGLPSEYFLSKRDGMPFGESEVIYPLVRDGEKLFSNLQPTVGRHAAGRGEWGS